MPVSRKRKKPKTSRTSPRRPIPQARAEAGSQDWSEIATALSGLTEQRVQLDAHRKSLAAEAAAVLMLEIVELCDERSAADLEDVVCQRLGAQLLAYQERPLADHIGPNQFAEALLTAAADAVRVALQERPGEPDGWLAPWQVLNVLTRVVPFPLDERARDLIEELRRAPDSPVSAMPADNLLVTGPVLWTRDVYGSRFGIIASFSAPDGPDRWYLWDVDACGYQPFTVYSSYFATPDEAMSAWRSGIGPVASADSVLAAVDDTWLMFELLPAEEGFLRPGGEDARQLAEYHRSKRLAEEVRQAVDPGRPRQGDKLDAQQAAVLFTAWLAENRSETSLSSDLNERVEELADSWSGGPAVLYHTCSPHRVAATTMQIRDYYQDDFAAELLALLPDWTSWLAAYNDTPPPLSERCVSYAGGLPHPMAGSADSRGPNYLARVAE